MRAVLSAWTAVAIASGAVARNQPSVPFMACIAATGERFDGQTSGINAGRITAQSSSGVSCVGVWQRLDDGTGAANFTCSDDRVGEALFRWSDPATGEARGTGSFTDGHVAEFWSGKDAAELNCPKVAS